MMSVPVMSDGIRSGVNWMRLNSQSERLRDGADQQRLRGPGQTGDQAVAADEQRDQHLFEHFVLTDDDAPDLRRRCRPSACWKRAMRCFSSDESRDVTTGDG